MWGYDELSQGVGHTPGPGVSGRSQRETGWPLQSLALSLASPVFRKVGPEARKILGVIASLPMISDREDIFGKLYSLPLTYKSNGFITTLVSIDQGLYPASASLRPGPQTISTPLRSRNVTSPGCQLT